MKKVLLVTTVSGFVPQFEMNNVRILQKLGYEIHYATNYNTPVYCNNTLLSGSGIIQHQIDFERSPFHIKNNIKAYFQLAELIKEEEFDMLHCHTPVGGVIGRLAFKISKKNNTKIIYTAHGFHFYKGAPLKCWILYYPVEKILSKYTDLLITINQEDYYIAKERFRAKKTIKIPGLGVNYEKYSNSKCDIYLMRKEFDIPSDAFVLITVGEINHNKNHKVVLKALRKINNKEIHYIICGQGSNEKYLINLSKKLGIDKQVHFVGYRNDIPEILKIADCYIMPSIREGLGMAAIEAMASGLPIITSDCRGAKEFSVNGVTGYMCKKNKSDEFYKAISEIYSDRKKAEIMSLQCKKKALEFSESITKSIMNNIYIEIANM